MITKRSLASGGSAAVALAIAATTYFVETPRPERVPAPIASQVGGPSPALASPLGTERDWSPGMQYTYTFEYEQKLAFQSDGKSFTPPPGFRVSLKGDLTATVTDALEDEIHVRYALRPSDIDVRADNGMRIDAVARAAFLRQLETPFYVSFEQSGAARRVHIEPGVDTATQRVLRSLVADSQVVLPGTGEPAWTAQEIDPTGQFEAAYRRVSEAEFTKTRVRYPNVATPQGLKQPQLDTQITPAGAIRFSLDENLWVDTLSGGASVKIVAGGGTFTALGDMTLELRRTARGHDAAAIGAFRASAERLAASSLAAAEPLQSEEEQLREILDGRTLESLMAELRGLPADDKESVRKTGKAMRRLAALFVLEPGAAARIPALIRGEPDRNTYSSLIGALSFATTREAIGALAEIAGDTTLGSKVRLDAISGLGGVGKPDARALEQLQLLARVDDAQLRSGATLALGAATGSLARNGDPLARRALDELVRETRAAETSQERRLLLRALANTASAEATPLIEEALSSQDVQVREAAVTSLRILPDPRADQLLTARLLQDPAPEVRRGAVFAASFRPIAIALPALTKALTVDSDASVRLDIVRLIGENRARIPDSATILALASEDANAQVRETAQRFLNAEPPKSLTP